MMKKVEIFKFSLTCSSNYDAKFSMLVALLLVDCYCLKFHPHLSHDRLRESIHLHWDRNLLKLQKEEREII